MFWFFAQVKHRRVEIAFNSGRIKSQKDDQKRFVTSQDGVEIHNGAGNMKMRVGKELFVGFETVLNPTDDSNSVFRSILH